MLLHLTSIRSVSENEKADIQPSSLMTSKQRQSNLMITLQNGKLLDQDGDTGYIAANYQFQFDKVRLISSRSFFFFGPQTANGLLEGNGTD